MNPSITRPDVIDPDQRDTHRIVFAIRAAAEVRRALGLLRLGYLLVEPVVQPCTDKSAHDSRQRPLADTDLASKT